MQLEGSLSCSQEYATGPYPETNDPSPQRSTLFPNIYFNVILQSTPRHSENWIFLCISILVLYYKSAIPEGFDFSDRLGLF